ncbi:hypothetical protein GW17_00033714 [Ensete ventricosum]|nr:hypothetical protein GW17_00033714 [Ensete ventricosum]RZR76929.1 hypothetical protein BHM03_00001840 [Ensete ventricosum]
MLGTSHPRSTYLPIPSLHPTRNSFISLSSPPPATSYHPARKLLAFDAGQLSPHLCLRLPYIDSPTQGTGSTHTGIPHRPLS